MKIITLKKSIRELDQTEAGNFHQFAVPGKEGAIAYGIRLKKIMGKVYFGMAYNLLDANIIATAMVRYCVPTHEVTGIGVLVDDPDPKRKPSIEDFHIADVETARAHEMLKIFAKVIGANFSPKVKQKLSATGEAVDSPS